MRTAHNLHPTWFTDVGGVIGKLLLLLSMLLLLLLLMASTGLCERSPRGCGHGVTLGLTTA
jgi:hypothetical protein